MADNAAKVATIAKLTAGGNAEGFPKEVLAPIWERAFAGSVVQQVAGTVPVSLAGNAVSMPVGQPVAGIVQESADKPVVDVSVGLKTFSPVKTAAIVSISKEALMANPLNAFDDLEGQLGEAIARSIDTAVIHGKDALTGAALTGKESLASTTNVVELDPAKFDTTGYLGKQLAAAYDKVVNTDGEEDYDFSEFLLSPKFRSIIMGATDGFGRPLYQASPNLADQFSSVLGIPAVYSKAVNGRGKVSEPNLLGFGGDLKENLRLGFVEGLTWASADQYAAGMDLFGTNRIAIRVEAIFGWVLRDPKAFVKITKKAG